MLHSGPREPSPAHQQFRNYFTNEQSSPRASLRARGVRIPRSLLLTIDQLQEFQFHFGRPPAQASQLDARGLSGQVACRLDDAANGPAEVPQDFPVGYRLAIHLCATCSLVSLKELLGVAYAAQLL